MGRILSLSIGVIVTVVGIILFIAWWNEILFVFRALIPGILILCGTVAAISGLSEFKDVLKEKEENK